MELSVYWELGGAEWGKKKICEIKSGKHKWISLIIILPQEHKPLGLDISREE